MRFADDSGDWEEKSCGTVVAWCEQHGTTWRSVDRLDRTRNSLRSKRFRRVWEQRKTEERAFRYFVCAENGARAKKRAVGEGEGKEGTACGQTPGFWKLPFAGERGSWLAGLVEHFWHVSIKGLKEGEDTFLFEACLQKALTFLAEWVFSRELWQYGRIL